jgi:hypothetical protein
MAEILICLLIGLPISLGLASFLVFGFERDSG